MCLICFIFFFYFFLDTPETPVLVRTITRADGPPVTVLSLCPALMSVPAPANNRLLARMKLLFFKRVHLIYLLFVSLETFLLFICGF